MTFKFKIYEEVVFVADGAIVKIIARKIGKEYKIKYKSGRVARSYVPEQLLRALKEGDL